jgi:hypothetical protein
LSDIQRHTKITSMRTNHKVVDSDDGLAVMVEKCCSE